MKSAFLIETDSFSLQHKMETRRNVYCGAKLTVYLEVISQDLDNTLECEPFRNLLPPSEHLTELSS
jgi:hypothetical protein